MQFDELKVKKQFFRRNIWFHILQNVITTKKMLIWPYMYLDILIKNKRYIKVVFSHQKVVQQNTTQGKENKIA